MARAADTKNADRPRTHLGPALLRRSLALLTEQELTDWRNSLLRSKTKHGKKLTPASINRTMSTVRAALTFKGLERAHIWRNGLQRLPNAEKTRNKLFVLPDAMICALVADAYTRDAKLGLLCEVLSETGARPSQAARLKVGYLIEHATAPRLSMPKSGKGGGKLRAEKKNQTYPVPISVGLAAKLKQAAAGRADDDRLLLRADGSPLNERDAHADYREPFAEIVKALGLNAKLTAYCFRHSSITRQLLRGVPVRVTASHHDTSVRMIESTYSKYIVDHSDQLTRAALLDHTAAPTADNVISMVR